MHLEYDWSLNSDIQGQEYSNTFNFSPVDFLITNDVNDEYSDISKKQVKESIPINEQKKIHIELEHIELWKERGKTILTENIKYKEFNSHRENIINELSGEEKENAALAVNDSNSYAFNYQTRWNEEHRVEQKVA